jgi:hypothetical protein
MAIRHLALMALAALAAGSYANTRRRAQRGSRSASTPMPVQTWEGEGGTGTDLADKAAPDQSDDLLTSGDSVALTEERPPATNSNPLPAGQNLP